MSELRRHKRLERHTELGRGKPLDRGSSQLRWKRSGVYSDRRRAELPAEWAARRAVVDAAKDRDGHVCQAQLVWPHDCWGGLVGHEPHKRSGGGDELDVDQVLTVCQLVNGKVEDDPPWAYELGLGVHSWETWSWTRDWRPRHAG